MNIKLISISIIAMTVMFHHSCAPDVQTDLTDNQIIPKPDSVIATGDGFEPSRASTIYYQEGSEKLKTTATYLASEIERVLGYTPVVKTTVKPPRRGIYLAVNEKKPALGNEGYHLVIENRRIRVTANQPSGCFYGIQSLLQLLPVNQTNEEALIIATGEIVDYPEYSYRGAMLDVSRHFFKVKDVKRVIDFLATYKMNHLHLHLSDDQGWRIEIKSWPKLTEIGSSTEVGAGEGGFYTQEEFSEIVEYAAERYVTIVPEIDMPGHTNAALASYPELNCDGKARKLYTGTRVGFSSLCTDKEITYTFVDDVVREIAAISPGPYFHIGGDESHVTPLDDYIYFINRVQEIVTRYGKKVIGWDEIANASLVDGAVVQFWSDVENTMMGVKKGAKVIMSPAKRAYLDMKYDSTTELGLNWAGYIDVDTAYNWNPADYVPGLAKDYILGVEAPLWTETVTNMDEIEYMVFPRLPGYAEIGWTTGKNREWKTYKLRLANHGKRFKDMDINFYKSPVVPWGKTEF